MQLRPATDADGDGIARVRAELGEAHDDSGLNSDYRRHLLDHGRLWVAVDNDEIIGFAGTRDIAGARMLCDLFIDSARLGSGIGGQLLSSVLGDSTSRFTFASSDPRALPLYMRAGMLPRWPLLYLDGSSALLVARCRAEDVAQECSLAEAITIESALTGHDRSVEYSYWAGRTGTRFVRVGDRAIGVIRQIGEAARLEHVVVSPDLDPSPVVAAMVAASGVERLVAYVRGTSPLASELLHARFAIVDSDTAMSSHDDLIPDALHVLHPGLM